MSTKLAVQVKKPANWKMVTVDTVPGCPNCRKAKDIEDVVATAHSAGGMGTSELCHCNGCGTDYINP